MHYKLSQLIWIIESHREAVSNRTNFYESPENRSIVLTQNEDAGTYYCRRDIDSNYHETLKELKKILKEFGFAYELSWAGEFYTNYINIPVRQAESRAVKKMLRHFELEALLPEWILACSMWARLRLLQRHYGNNSWWKKHVGKKYGERSQACIYRYEFSQQYLAQRKKVFKAIRQCARKHNLNYQQFPLNPKQIFSITL